MARETSHKIRLTADLPFAEAKTLQRLAAEQAICISEALRRAIATDSLVKNRLATGSRVLLETENQLSELVFTR